MEKKKYTKASNEYDSFGYCHNKKCDLVNTGVGNCGCEEDKFFTCVLCHKRVFVEKLDGVEPKDLSEVDI